MSHASFRLLAVALTVALAAACHDGAGPSSEYDRVAGAWVTDVVSVDEIAGSGHATFSAPLRLVMQRGGAYSVRELGSVIDTGTVALLGDSLRFHSTMAEGADADFAMSWRFDHATLVLAQPVQWDFDTDEVAAVPARATYRFERP